MPGQIECPHCGKKMAIGYPRCLSCKKHLGPTDSPLKKMARSKKATYVVLPEEKSFRWPWLALVIALLCIAFLLQQRNKTKATSTPAAVQPQTGKTVSNTPSNTGVDAAPATNVAPAKATKSVDESKVSDLNQSLSEAGIYSTVFSEGNDNDIVVVESSSCNSENMTQTIEDQKKILKEAGFVKVQCFAKHGALVFEVPL